MRPRRIVALLIVASPLALGGQRALAAQGRGAPDPGAAPPLSSYQLIDRALEGKRIDEETAHKYRVFAAFGDSRLPVQYRGTDAAPEPPREVETAGSLLDTFSAQTQAELAPFFMRPDESGSWITLGTVSDQEPEPGAPPPPNGERGRTPAYGASAVRFAGLPARPRRLFRSRPSARTAAGATQITWQSFTAAGGKAKVWAQDRYAGDAAKAQGIAKALTNRIWDKLNDLMDPEPVSDGQLPKNGGDGALDFYLVHAPMELNGAGKRVPEWLGLTEAAARAGSLGECFRERYLLIDSRQPLDSVTGRGILMTVAHELMHAITLAYRAKDDGGCGAKWILEGSATWAENYVYPDANDEHPYATDYLQEPKLPIDSNRGKTIRYYGTYLFPLFQEKTIPGPGAAFMPAIWDKFRTKSALEGINEVLSGGWDKAWPQFLITNLNQPPVDAPKGYKGWDRLPHRALVRRHDDVDARQGPVTEELDLPVRVYEKVTKTGPESVTIDGLEYLAGWYHQFKFQQNVRSVFLSNAVAQQPHASVWGIQKIRGKWKDPEDWTRDFGKAWCRDDPNEDIEELIVVFGNSDWQDQRVLKPRETSTLKAYPTGCTAWTGSLTTTLTMESNGGAVTHVEKANATMRFEIDSAYIIPGQPREYWKVTSGNIWWTATVTGECTGGGQGSLPITYRGRGADQATLRVFLEADTMRYSGSMGPWPGDNPRYPVTCPDKPPGESLLWITGAWYVTDLKNNKVTENGKSIIGAYTVRNTGTGGTHTIKYEYTFRLSP